MSSRHGPKGRTQPSGREGNRGKAMGESGRPESEQAKPNNASRSPQVRAEEEGGAAVAQSYASRSVMSSGEKSVSKLKCATPRFAAHR